MATSWLECKGPNALWNMKRSKGLSLSWDTLAVYLAEAAESPCGCRGSSTSGEAFLDERFEVRSVSLLPICCHGSLWDGKEAMLDLKAVYES